MTEKRTTITIRFEPETYALFSALCALNGETMSGVLRECANVYIEKNKTLLNLDALKAGENKK